MSSQFGVKIGLAVFHSDEQTVMTMGILLKAEMFSDVVCQLWAQKEMVEYVIWSAYRLIVPLYNLSLVQQLNLKYRFLPKIILVLYVILLA